MSKVEFYTVLTRLWITEIGGKNKQINKNKPNIKIKFRIITKAPKIFQKKNILNECDTL